MRKKIILIIILVFLGIIFLFLAKYWPSEEKKEGQTLQGGYTTSTPSYESSHQGVPLPQRPEKKQVDLKTQPIQLARVFIERYGSYSTDTSPDYLEELLPLMSKSFVDRTKEKIKEISQNPASEFYGQTTKIISLRIKEMDENRAEFDAQVQIEKTKGKEKTTSYEMVELVLVREKNQWKVDSCSF